MLEDVRPRGGRRSVGKKVNWPNVSRARMISTDVIHDVRTADVIHDVRTADVILSQEYRR